MGATTVWERWNGIDEHGELRRSDMNSFNHYAYGAVAAWIYRTALGIKPLLPGYSEISVAPFPCRAIGSTKSRILTRSSEIISGWSYDGDTVLYEITMPKGLKAYISFPDGSKKLHTGGILSVKIKATD